MKLEDQVCSLELAKRLKELGVKQKSFFWWKDFGEEGNLAHIHVASEDFINERGNTGIICSAFTVAELGEMLGIHLGEWGPQYANETEADYRAKTLIYLIENKTIVMK